LILAIETYHYKMIDLSLYKHLTILWFGSSLINILITFYIAYLFNFSLFFAFYSSTTIPQLIADFFLTTIFSYGRYYPLFATTSKIRHNSLARWCIKDYYRIPVDCDIVMKSLTIKFKFRTFMIGALLFFRLIERGYCLRS